MKISYNWLRNYIHLPESPEKVVDMLTALGLEVEHVQPFESIKGSLQGLVIGEIRTCIKHPGADLLSLTTVDIGEEALCQIVCGAPNIAVGQKVVVAKPGTTLYPSQGSPFIIKKAKIRGEHSAGMICSEAEIGISNTHETVIVLDNIDLPNGSPAAAVYPVETDAIFDIGLTPNRGDATSHIGVGRDISALKRALLKWPSIAHFVVDKPQSNIGVTVEDPMACPRYTATTLSDIIVKTSPKWLQDRLTAIGVTPINNVVDITNYVCHELGQPLHALDADKIAGNQVVVKTMPAGSTFKTLDNKLHTLTTTDLMVCDTQAGMCMAGILGGADHGITEQTKRVFLESAYFAPERIRASSVHHHIKTDASFRFERGVDPTRTAYALKRAAMLIKEVAGGTITSDIIDIYPKKIAPKPVTLKDKNVDRLIGIHIAREEIFDILEALEMPVTKKTDTSYTVSVPPYRVGVEQEADVVEEILRIYGFDRIPLQQHASANYLAHFPSKDINQYKKNIGEMLSANGFYEIMTNSITRKEYGEKYDIASQEAAIDILNASTPQHSTLRQTLLFTGLEVCAYNINRKQKNLKLFEWGKTYGKHDGQYVEKDHLALYISGQATAENWQQKTQPVTHFDIAKYITAILVRCNLAGGVVQHQNIESPLLEYGTQWCNGDSIVVQAGLVKSQITNDLDITQEVFFADFDQKALFAQKDKIPAVTDVPRYPEVRRDLSLLLDSTIPFKEVEQLALSTARKYLSKLIVFDVYEGAHIPRGKKAYGIGCILLDRSKTLRERDIDKTMNALIHAFEKKMGAIIRK